MDNIIKDIEDLNKSEKKIVLKRWRDNAKASLAQVHSPDATYNYEEDENEPGKIPLETVELPTGATIVMGGLPNEELMSELNPIMKQRNEIARNLSKLIFDQAQKQHETFKQRLSSEAVEYDDKIEQLNPNTILQTIGEKTIKHYDPALHSEMLSSVSKHSEIADADEKYNDEISALTQLKGLIKDIDNAKTIQAAVKKYNGKDFVIIRQDSLKILGIDPDLFYNATLINKKGEPGAEEARQQLDDLLNNIENNQTMLLNAKKVNQMNRMKKQLEQVTELQDRIVTDVKSRPVFLDRHDELYAEAEPTLDSYKELISKYSKFLTPAVITDLETDVKQIKDYIEDARRKGYKAGELRQYHDLVNKVRENVRNHYQDILNKMQAYSNSVYDEDAIISEIKSLASYEQYSQLPPDIFEKLPEDIKSKVMRLMELKAKLQKQQGKTKNISQKYKINASNKPVSEDKEHAKVFNPMLNRGYSIFNKVAQHNAYNAGFL